MNQYSGDSDCSGGLVVEPGRSVTGFNHAVIMTVTDVINIHRIFPQMSLLQYLTHLMLRCVCVCVCVCVSVCV